jgi:hypothetical protein
MTHLCNLLNLVQFHLIPPILCGFLNQREDSLTSCFIHNNLENDDGQKSEVFGLGRLKVTIPPQDWILALME